MLNRTFGKVLTGLAIVGSWILLGARLVLDMLDYATIPENFQVARTRIDQALDYLFEIPWWALLTFAGFSTAWLIWLSWSTSRFPRITGSKPTDLTQNSQPDPSRINPLETYFSKKVLRAADLIYDSKYVVENKVFEDCEFYGPAVVSILTDVPAQVSNCTFNGDPQSIFIELPNKLITGVIGFRGCSFMRCKFTGIAFAGPKVVLDHMKANLGLI